MRLPLTKISRHWLGAKPAISGTSGTCPLCSRKLRSARAAKGWDGKLAVVMGQV